MRKNLLSIGEVAKLKKVSVKALRYYESIGLFSPVHVDPSSGYRYYAPSQLFDLDVITTCSELDIPLKSLLDYTDERGMLNMDTLLETGRDLARKRIRQAEDSLMRIDTFLEEASLQDRYNAKSAPYERTVGEWNVIAAPWKERTFNVRSYVELMTALYADANEKGACPLYFQGLSISAPSSDEGTAKPHAYAYIRIARTPEAPLNEGFTLMTMSPRTCTGRRIKANNLEGYMTAFKETLEQAPGYYLLTEVWDKEVSKQSYVLEALKAKKPFLA